MTNTLYRKHNYIDKTLTHIISASIKEYDIKSAGFNMLIAAKALPDKKIEELKAMPKKERNIKIGLMIRKDKNLGKIINDNLVEYRRRFMERNGIPDSNILSIKKDAIFLINQPVRSTRFDNVEFVMKNQYSSFYNLRDVEFYYSPEHLHVKGLGKEVPKQHEKYMLRFLNKLFKQAEMATDTSVVCQTLSAFANDYRNRELKLGYYREMNSSSMYKLTSPYDASMEFLIPQAKKIDKPNIDIRYNYMKYIVPLIRIFY